MPSLRELAPAWERRLAELAAAHGVPGAALGVSHRGERFVATAGVAGLRNPAPVTEDTAFQLGSISKLYTATLLMAVAGPDILARPVAELAPEAAWLESEVTVAHLLTHSSGLGGDTFADTGRGDDALARYVAHLESLSRDVPPPPGRHYSYCNSGYGVLGRIVERLTGRTYDTALRERLLAPLRAAATTTLSEDTILRPVALGHNREGDGPLRADDRWNFARACAALGGVCAPPGDVLTFAELHLADGRTADGAALLAPDVAALMRRRHLATPPLARPDARGLGWGIYDWEGGELIGHDGETLGQIASLRLSVAHELAVVVLTNAIPDGDELTSALLTDVLSAWGLRPVTLTRPPADPAFDPSPYLGRYRNLMATIEVAGADGGLALTTHYDTEGVDEQTETVRLAPLGDGAFVDASTDRPTRAARFTDPGPDGRCGSYFNGRVFSRVDADAHDRGHVNDSVHPGA